MSYLCENCGKESKQCNLEIEKKKWVCNDCYFHKEESIVKYKQHGNPKTKSSL